MPGHITKEGFKINDGDCPFYALLKQKATDKSCQVSQETPEGYGIAHEPLDLEVPAIATSPAGAAQPVATKQATGA